MHGAVGCLSYSDGHSWYDLTVTQLTTHIHSGFALMCIPDSNSDDTMIHCMCICTCKIVWHLRAHGEGTACRESFDLHRVEVEEWHCQFLLDDALNQASQSAPASLQAACTILPGAALSCLGYGTFFLGYCMFCPEASCGYLTKSKCNVEGFLGLVLIVFGYRIKSKLSV